MDNNTGTTLLSPVGFSGGPMFTNVSPGEVEVESSQGLSPAFQAHPGAMHITDTEVNFE